MIGEKRQVGTDERVEVQDCSKITHKFERPIQHTPEISAGEVEEFDM